MKATVFDYIVESDMSVRAWNAIMSYFKNTLKEDYAKAPVDSLLKIELKELQKYRGVGKKVLIEIEEIQNKIRATSLTRSEQTEH